MTHMEQYDPAEDTPDDPITPPPAVPNTVPVESTPPAEDDHPVVPKRRMNPVIRGLLAVLTALGALFLAAFITDLFG